MVQRKSEKTLLIIVIILIIGFGGMFIYKKFGENMFLLEDGLDDKINAINTLLSEQEKAAEITAKFEDMEKELKLEGSDSEQVLKIREDLAKILEQVGLKNKYRSIVPKDPQRDEDFKIVSISIDQIECTPSQLGQLLYRLEKESKVMEITNCRITNMMNEVGDIGGYGLRRQGNQNQLSPLNGLLSINLEISRLIEYRQDEIKKRKRS